jgi:hypothetical protein
MGWFRAKRPAASSESSDRSDASALDGALAAADRAEADGRLLDAIEGLQAANRRTADPEVEVRLVRLRHQAFGVLDRTVGRDGWPPVYADHFPDATDQPPEVSPGELDAELLGSGLTTHGALLVRGLVPPTQVPGLVDGIDRAFAGRDASGDGSTAADTAPWFVPFGPESGYEGPELSRVFVREGGGVWTADSPRVMFELLDLFAQAGLDRVISEYLGERPAVSLRKWVLRRVPADLGRADWHQDGAFLGDQVRSVNVWLALSECGAGTDASGLDLVPRRVELLPTGTDGAIFDWSVGPGLVDTLVADAGTAVMRPRFEPGDALLFDDRLLHRTAVGPEMARERYAIESWFFAPSTYPADQIPLVF